jgi:serine/threonine-protein kinase
MPVETDILPPRYRGPQRVGRGGMGEIYRATDATLGRAVAIKVLAERYAEDDAVRERFTREALAAARLSGEPNIVTIFDVGDWNDRPFIVMEYLAGGSLEEKLRREGAQPTQQACEWLEDTARALDAAHGHGVVHRDVKPANLLLDRDDNVYVADFGIASAAGLDSMTMTGTVMGTAGYLSPEQAQGDRATAASDRYAFGVVAFELLTGTRPFEAESMTAEAAAHVHADVPSVCDRLSSLPCELDPVFQRALAKEPGGRYATCAEFVADLRQALHEAAGMTRQLERVPAAPPPPPADAPARARRFPVVPALLGLALIGAGILAAPRGGAGIPADRPGGRGE